ncbi:hypothetical protein GC197_03240 [bacterium]|nr:hypothetical protein [bacterium]
MNRFSFLLRFRTFNIKVLLVAVALIAVLLGVVRHAYWQSWQEYQLRQLGVDYVSWDEDGNIDFLGLATTRHLPEIARGFDCSHVRNLYLAGLELDSSVTSANQFTGLICLHVNSTNLDDALARHITGVSAKVFRVTDTKLTRDGVEFLLKSNQMESIAVTDTIMTKHDAEELSQKYGVIIYLRPKTK